MQQGTALRCQLQVTSSVSHMFTGLAGLMSLLGYALQAVYTALREAEYRSTAFVPYWKVHPAVDAFKAGCVQSAQLCRLAGLAAVHCAPTHVL
jgi:hypothetical protein